jgi:hypothetical protein
MSRRQCIEGCAERERERERERYLRLNEERRWRKKGFDEDLGVLI